MFQPASFTLKVETIRCKYIATTPEEGRRDDLGRQREATDKESGSFARLDSVEHFRAKCSGTESARCGPAGDYNT